MALSEDDPSDGQWHDLARRVEAHPFVRPAWIRAWWDVFGNGGTLRILTVRDEGGMRAAIPMVTRLGTLRYPANDHTPMVSILADARESRDALSSHLMELGAFTIEVPHLRADGDSLSSLVAAAGEHGYRTRVRPGASRPYLDLAGLDDPLRCLSAKRRKELGRRARRLGELGDLRMDVHTTASGLDGILDRVLAVEAKQWKGRQGTAILGSPHLQRFYRRVAGAAASDGSLRLNVLSLGERVVSFSLDLKVGRCFYGLKTGYDPEFSRYSPGHLLIVEALRLALADGAHRYEFLGAADPYKMEWTNTVHHEVALHAVRSGPIGALAYAARLPPAVLRRMRRRLAVTARARGASAA